MLKKTWKLFLGLVVCTGSACVTPTHASSAPSVIITHIQAASINSAKDEMVVLYNNSDNVVDITDWCLMNKSNIAFACFTSGEEPSVYSLEPRSHAVIASESLVERRGLLTDSFALAYSPTNQSSGSIVNSNDKISLVNGEGVGVDSHAWSTALPSGKGVSRQKSLTTPHNYDMANALVSWFYESLTEVPLNGVQVAVLPTNPEPSEPTDPIDPIEPSNPTEPIQPMIHLEIVEILPNPKGADAGNEFIELYNPNPTTAISLAQYKLRVGPHLEKVYSFPLNTVIMPLQYRAFTNNEIKFALLNSTSAVQLQFNGQLLGHAIVYENPPEDFSYANHEGFWQYTKKVTPNHPNQIELAANRDEEDESLLGLNVVSTVKPCAAHQYRSTETNRCRNLVATTSASAPKPCASNQYRSLETNRCRNIISSTGTPTPCKVGQERNPETNRCRNVVSMTKAGHSLKDVETDDSSTGTRWYWWLGIGGVVALILAYATYEWRQELLKGWQAIRMKVARLQK